MVLPRKKYLLHCLKPTIQFASILQGYMIVALDGQALGEKPPVGLTWYYSHQQAISRCVIFLSALQWSKITKHIISI